ncbi:MAG TPA: GNAT family N-acetyltransferase [Methylomirabilota bacterium]
MIRGARPSDRPDIEAVTLAAYEQYAAVVPPRLWQQYRRNIISTLADATADITIVAEAEGALVGSVLLCPAGTELPAPGHDASARRAYPEVRLLAVAPTARGRGVGRGLMDECIRRARASGTKALTLHTTDMMQVAMQLYERMGFVHAASLDLEIAPGVLVKGYRLDL